MSCNVLSTVELNGIEKYYVVNGGWTTIAHTADLSGNYSTLITNASGAVQNLLKRHPRMRTRLRLSTNQYLLDFLEYNSEYLTSNVFFSTVETTNDSWQEIVERRCNQDPYSNNGTMIFPLFHFMLLYNSQQSDDHLFHLILFQNHCVSDGRSGIILINDFLTLATTSNLLETSEPFNTENLPFIDQLIPRPYGPLYPLFSFLGKQIFKHELRKMMHPRIPVKVIPLIDCEPTIYHVQRYKSKFLFASTSADLYSKLHQQCRFHEMTLNGPLFACFLLAIHHCFPLDNENRLKPFGVGMPFDMRMRLPESSLTSTSIGFFVGFNELKLDPSLSIQSTRFWSLAHKCMSITRNQLKRHGIPLMMNIFADILRDDRYFNGLAQLVPDGRQSEISISNIGKYPFSCQYNQGEIRLHGIHVINNGGLYRVSNSMFITCAGDAQLDISWAHEMDSDERAKGFIDYYIRLIETCADSDRCKTEITLDQLLKMVESN